MHTYIGECFKGHFATKFAIQNHSMKLICIQSQLNADHLEKWFSPVVPPDVCARCGLGWTGKILKSQWYIHFIWFI